MSNDGGAMGATSEGNVAAMTINSIKHDDSKETSTERSTSVEKGQLIETKETDEEPVEEDLSAFSHEYPFPINPDEEVETQQFTFRAVFVGCLLGAVISASKYALPV